MTYEEIFNEIVKTNGCRIVTRPMAFMIAVLEWAKENEWHSLCELILVF